MSTPLFGASLEDRGGWISVEQSFEDGVAMFLGQGRERNIERAIECFEFAAQRGHQQASLNLGFIYDTGIGRPADDREAAKWYRIAAEAGDPTALFNLGILHEFGNGIETNHAQAADYYQRAARQGVAGAQFNLANLYLKGLGVPRDPVLAEAWYLMAALQSHPEALEQSERLAEILSPEQMEAAGQILRAFAADDFASVEQARGSEI